MSNGIWENTTDTKRMIPGLSAATASSIAGMGRDWCLFPQKFEIVQSNTEGRDGSRGYSWF